MKKRSKTEVSSDLDTVQEQAGPDLAVLIAAVQQQLASLEKKVDTLISRCPEKPQAAQAAQFVQAAPSPYQHQRFDKPRYDHHPRSHVPGRQDAAFASRMLHKAVCADCKKECAVPFKPTGERPVYCKDCFAKRRTTSVPFNKEAHASAPRQPYQPSTPAPQAFTPAPAEHYKKAGHRKGTGAHKTGKKFYEKVAKKYAGKKRKK